MRKLSQFLIMCLGFLASASFCPNSFSQQMSDISSDHLLMRLPKERALLARGVITDLERFYTFLDGAIDAKLPRKINLLIDWDLTESRANYRQSSILVGMNQPIASNPKSFLFNESMREITRLGLLELSHGAERPDYEFLYEGMIEILVNEFNHTSRSLESAWVISKFLDEMGLLGLDVQRSWSDFSGQYRCFKNAAPGITFLSTFRDLKGRERPDKFFKGLQRTNLSKSLEDAFGEPASELEKIWLKKVREYQTPDEITITPEEVPKLAETVLSPDAVQAGDNLNIRFRFIKTAEVLFPEGVFVRDERTGKIFQAQADSDSMLSVIPVGNETVPGQYNYCVTAIDESGNLQNWKGSYKVTAP